MPGTHPRHTQGTYITDSNMVQNKHLGGETWTHRNSKSQLALWSDSLVSHSSHLHLTCFTHVSFVSWVFPCPHLYVVYLSVSKLSQCSVPHLFFFLLKDFHLCFICLTIVQLGLPVYPLSCYCLICLTFLYFVSLAFNFSHLHVVCLTSVECLSPVCILSH